MNTLNPSSWAPRRRLLVVALVLIVQVALIFALSERKPRRPRQPAHATRLHLAGNASRDLLDLGDPTLFTVGAGSVLEIPALDAAGLALLALALAVLALVRFRRAGAPGGGR